MSDALLLLLCVALDLALGDPPTWPHPVRLIGAAASRLEPWAVRSWPLWRGALCTVALASSSALAAIGATSLPWVGCVVSVYLGFAGLALGCLLRESRAVRNLLASGDVDSARCRLALLVSRDTAPLDAAGISRGLAETVAENFNDGFVAPLFWFAVGGVGGLWAYKAVSTLDSMWGYRTPRYRQLGTWAARGDDLAAWIPARLAAAALVLVAALWGRRVPWRTLVAQARAMESPNAGWPMAAAAHAVGATMGGGDWYAGVFRHKPQLGPQSTPWTLAHLVLLERMVLGAGLLVAGVAVLVRAAT